MALWELADRAGRLAVLAIDHRDSLRAFLAPDDPESIDAGDIVELKIELVEALGAHATGVMLEPEYSIPQVLDAGALPTGVGFLAALESQGYLDEPGAGPTTLLDGWSVEAAAASGAAGVKLLLPYHPDRPLAVEQERVAAEVLAECRRVGIPLVLEPLFYDLDGPSDRTRVVHTTVDRFVALGPDLLKLPFPGDPAGDPASWGDACAWVGERLPVPWALLSGGGSFEAFADQLEAAVSGGCSGFMVGRALWGDAVRAAPEARRSWLADEGPERLGRLAAICAAADVGRGSSRIVVEAAADSLDANDFDRLRSLLAPGCEYRIGADVHRGPDAILASYGAGMAKAEAIFDSYEFDHSIEREVGPRAWLVDFRDGLVLGGETLEHHSIQELTVGPDGRVVAIRDVTPPDEHAKTRAFLDRHGAAS